MHELVIRGGAVVDGTGAPGHPHALRRSGHLGSRSHAVEDRAAVDLPAGGRPLIQRADGYVATLVGGEVTYERGEPAGECPGRPVRFSGGGSGPARRIAIV